MTTQQQADRLLLVWQAHRHLAPAARLAACNDNGDAAVIAEVDRDLAAVAGEMSRDDRATLAFASIIGVGS